AEPLARLRVTRAKRRASETTQDDDARAALERERGHLLTRVGDAQRDESHGSSRTDPGDEPRDDPGRGTGDESGRTDDGEHLALLLEPNTRPTPQNAVEPSSRARKRAARVRGYRPVDRRPLLLFAAASVTRLA